MSNLAKKKSHIWKHFSIINKDKAKCDYCSKVISYSGGGTGNLTRHIKKLHGTVSIEQPMTVEMREQPIQCVNPRPEPDTPVQTGTDPETIVSNPGLDVNCVPSTSTARETRFASSSEKQTRQAHVQSRIQNYAKSTRPLPVSKSKQLDEQIVKFIVKGYHSFAIVEEKEFKVLFYMILPTYTLPTRKTISSSLIPKLYESTKDKVLRLISEADAICLTTDGWTSNSNVSFVALTAHYIDKNTELKSFLLGCTQFDERHTAENLQNFLSSEVSYWDISHKIAGMVTDNAANIVAAVHLTTWRHFPCFAHTVNLVVQHGLNAIKEQLDQVKTIVQYFKHSSSANSRLRAMQAQMELPPLKLKQSVVTRWNSTYDMLARLLKIKDAVVSILAIEQPRLNTLTPDGWMLLQKCVEVLKIFYEVTEEMSAEKSVSISKVIVLVRIMKMHVEKYLTEGGPDKLVQLLRTLRDQLHDRFREIEGNVLAAEASFLDPRFKKHAFSSTDKYDQCLKSVQKKLCVLFKQNENSALTESTPATNYTESQHSTSSMWEVFDKEVENEIVRNPTAASIVELDKYLNEPLIKRTDDPLKWWNDRRHLYPHLYILMKRRLCVTATSVPCERIFSKAGMTITDKRSSLKPKKASQILFLNYNL